MRNFRNYEIWRKGIQLVKEIYKIANKLPQNEQFGIRSQITRAAVSVPSNIAEGCSRNSDIEFKRFLEISLGSLFELETQLIIISELKLINIESENLLNEVNILEKQINSFISKLKPSTKN